MTLTAPPGYSYEDKLVADVRGYAMAASGRGMHVTVSGEHLAAVLERMDRLAATPPPAPAVKAAEPAWQEPLALVLPILDDILQSGAYRDLRDTNVVDALTAWATRNGTTIDADTLAAVTRALAGG